MEQYGIEYNELLKNIIGTLVFIIKVDRNNLLIYNKDK